MFVERTITSSVLENIELRQAAVDQQNSHLYSLFCLFVCFVLATPRGFQGLSSPTRDRTQAPAVKALSPNYWTTREFPSHLYS